MLWPHQQTAQRSQPRSLGELDKVQRGKVVERNGNLGAVGVIIPVKSTTRVSFGADDGSRTRMTEVEGF
jgi:hypothetical protein